MNRLITFSSVIVVTLISMLLVSCSPDKPVTDVMAEESSGEGATPAEVSQASAIWLTDFEKAKAESGKSGRPIFALFTGSDWCGWCIALHGEVLSKPEFIKYAGEHLVLFKADFPRTIKQDDAEKAQNQALSSKYGVRGFPTVMILNADGNQLAQTGYQAGGALKYVKHIQALLKSAD